MHDSRRLEGVHREWRQRPVSPRLRRAAALFTALSALMGMTLATGPATAEPTAEPCALPRSDVHHSEGLDTWNHAYPRPDRPLEALMAFLSFPDSEPHVTPGEIAADYFPETSQFFERASYGRTALRPHSLPGWAEMPAGSESYGIRRDWAPELRAAYLRDAVAVIDPRVDFTEYDIVYLIADPDAPGVDSDATKVINLDRPVAVDGGELHRIATVFEQRPPDRNVLAHETGHAFDLPDLYHRPRGGMGDWDTYVGDWDLMGSQFGLAPELFGWHKWKLGWLDGSQVDCVRSPGRTRHLVAPLAAPPAGSGSSRRGAEDTRLVVVRTGVTEALALEVREPLGNDRGLCTAGVLLYRVRSDVSSTDGPVKVVDTHPYSSSCQQRSVHPPLADAPLGEGESRTLHEDGVRVRVGARTKTGWEVEITVR